ncbi:MAG: bifunctional ADP-dependent NAD(P)H-hydrate dehydratase/NAD(P)H-hydrate epimerase, partial [Candidatus Omnitrophota bacterium]
MKPVTAAKMKQIDAEAIEKYGIPPIVLMENAGRAVAHLITPYLKSKTNIVAIFCGRGNNGGDGLVCARHLINNNYK